LVFINMVIDIDPDPEPEPESLPPMSIPLIVEDEVGEAVAIGIDMEDAVADDIAIDIDISIDAADGEPGIDIDWDIDNSEDIDIVVGMDISLVAILNYVVGGSAFVACC
jgi:hypothetical protein